MSVRESDGRVGLPCPLAELTARRWDAVVVGGGHNGLTAAAYLARAGRAVLVLERRGQLGGACTLDRPFPDERYLISPCAYLVGLLHPLVVEELGLRRLGFRVHRVDPHLWCPFDDGTALALWDDDDASASAVAAVSPGDVAGFLAYQRLFARIREALRRPDQDVWLGASPDRDGLEERLGHDAEAVDVLFHASIAEVVERHVRDGRLRTALHGQGIVGTWAGPRDPGTAAIHAMHSLGTTEGRGGAWGYVHGGMGQVSFALADAAVEAGAVIASGVEVTAIVPGEGVELEGGDRISAAAVVSNADPRRTLALCRGEVPDSFARRVEAWRMEGPVVKLNCALSRLPRFTAATPEGPSPYRAMVTICGGIDETQEGYQASRAGEPAPVWCELYFQTAYDPSVAPPGRHVMSVFAQYAPYRLARGSWEERREEVGDAIVARIRRFAPDVAEVIEHRQVLGPPDLEHTVGLSGGHIFQGECLPDQMWDRRFSPRTPVPGLYLCGAATHPGGSVMAVNGRNAAMAVLSDLSGLSGRGSPGPTPVEQDHAS
ncbi:MAG TPA: NAD(P)/FAD-dependent oxidoreductase [Acidimicrobiales bacterium]|nr:NAD(P)/FAD-dependent oxidoreductase [Acidimicrobiales bacterium]